MLNTNLSEKIKKIRLPCLIIFGDQDNYVSIGFAKELVGLLQNGSLIVMKNTNHWLPVLNPNEFFENIDRFIKGKAEKLSNEYDI